MSSLQLLSRDSFSFFLFLSLPISHGKDAAINVCLAPAAGNARLPLPNATLSLSYATVQLLPEPPECTFISYSLIACAAHTQSPNFPAFFFLSVAQTGAARSFRLLRELRPTSHTPSRAQRKSRRRELQTDARRGQGRTEREARARPGACARESFRRESRKRVSALRRPLVAPYAASVPDIA
eukprot:2131242-Rhodomonas_salina.3